MGRKLTVLIGLVIFIGTLWGGVTVSSGSPAEKQDTITMTYQFKDVTWANSGGVYTPSAQGLTRFSKSGLPEVLVKNIEFVLPQGKTVSSVKVEKKNTKIFAEKRISAAPQYLPTGDSSAHDLTAETKRLANAIYNGGQKFPTEEVSKGRLQVTRGINTFALSLFPMSYEAGKVTYAKEMTVVIKLKDADKLTDNTYAPSKEDQAMLSDDVLNRAAINTYTKVPASKRLSSASSSSNFDYVIITNAAMASAFTELADYHTRNGHQSKIVTVEEIRKTYSGRDLAEKIRNFIKDAYDTSGVRFVLLGGDADSESPIIPTRQLWVDSVTDDTTNWVASDNYYACLDGSYDENGNGIYGEPTDGFAGGDIDYTYDVYVGRAPVDNYQEAANFVQKTLTYSGREKQPTAYMIGENLSSNYDCSLELAASEYPTESSNSIDSFRQIRDKKIKSEYVDLYYKSNDILKSVLSDNPKLLLKLSCYMGTYGNDILDYARTGTSHATLSAKEIASLNEFILELSDAIKNSDSTSPYKAVLLNEASYLSKHLVASEGRTVAEIFQSSHFAEKQGFSTSDYSRLGDVWGGDYKDEIANGASTNNIETRGTKDIWDTYTLYDRDSEDNDWPKESLIDVLNNNPERLNHMGHANTTTMMKLEFEDLAEIQNSESFFLYSQGCYAGSFDNIQADGTSSSQDSIAEELIKLPGNRGAAAAVVNSRYGWYSPDGTDGPSQAYDRWFWHYMVTGEDGRAGVLAAQSKHKVMESMADWGSNEDVMRFCYYELTLLGDPLANLTAAETSSNHTVEFVVNGKIVATQTVSHNTATTAPESPVKPSYKFMGWYDLWGNKFFEDAPVMSDATYYARFYSENDYLKKLSASSGTWKPRFEKTKVSYTLTLAKRKSSVKLTASKADSMARVSWSTNDNQKWSLGSSKTISVSKGKAKYVYFKVTSQSGATKIYKVKVYRKR